MASTDESDPRARSECLLILPSGAATPTHFTWRRFLRFSDPGCCRYSILPWNQRLMMTSLTAVVVLLMMTTTTTDGTCNEEQIDTCRESALDGRLGLLKSGGQCSPKRYAEFSHLCSVTNYLPNVEYCCCIYETNVLCCRYHQDWNLFRCQMEEDVVDTTSGIIDHLSEGDDGSGLCCPPLEFLLPAILVPLFLVVCCLYVCLKYWKQCGGGSADSICCSSSHHPDDDISSINPRKNRKDNDFVEVGLSSSLNSSDANSTLPLAHNGCLIPTSTTEKSSLYPTSTIEPIGPSVSSAPGHSTSLFDYEEDDPYFPGSVHRYYSPAVQPSAPPLFDDPEATAQSCAFYQEPSEGDNCDEYCGARYRDIGGRLRPLYRTNRSNFSSGGRSNAPGPLVHRGMGEGRPNHRSTKHDRCGGGATYRMTGTTYPARACSVSPPPPSYEQSCNQNNS